MKNNNLKKRKEVRTGSSEYVKFGRLGCIAYVTPDREPPTFAEKKIERGTLSESHSTGKKSCPPLGVDHKAAQFTPSKEPPKPPKK